MAENTDTGSVKTDTGTNPTLIRVYRNDDAGPATTLIPRNELRSYQHMGWTREDPAFTPDPDILKAAENNNGRVLMHSNLGGTPRYVRPEAVTWHTQNGWTITS
jgi:hypothetical protein